VPQLLAPVTVHKHIFIIVLATGLTLLFIILFVRDFEEHGGVYVGDLGALFDRVRRNDLAYDC